MAAGSTPYRPQGDHRQPTTIVIPSAVEESLILRINAVSESKDSSTRRHSLPSRLRLGMTQE